MLCTGPLSVILHFKSPHSNCILISLPFPTLSFDWTLQYLHLPEYVYFENGCDHILKTLGEVSDEQPDGGNNTKIGGPGCSQQYMFMSFESWGHTDPCYIGTRCVTMRVQIGRRGWLIRIHQTERNTFSSFLKEYIVDRGCVHPDLRMCTIYFESSRI